MDSSQRLKWDDDLENIHEIKRFSDHLLILHVVNKAPLNFKCRDFVEKRLSFSYKGAFYIYVTYVPDKVHVAKKSYQRARCLYGYYKIEKDPKSSGVKF